jgi:hypothetical protein
VGYGTRLIGIEQAQEQSGIERPVMMHDLTHIRPPDAVCRKPVNDASNSVSEKAGLRVESASAAASVCHDEADTHASPSTGRAITNGK